MHSRSNENEDCASKRKLAITPADFDLVALAGRGAFGKVRKMTVNLFSYYFPCLLVL